MKSEECAAKIFLAARYGSDPIYEPLGPGKPPDFSVDKNAYEVRRLNERHTASPSVEGLEQIAISLSRAVREQLGQIPFSSEKGSWVWSVRFRRPLAKSCWVIAKEIGRQATGFYSSGGRNRHTVEAHGVAVELIPVKADLGKAFVQVLEVDDDSGGPVSQIYTDGIRLALAEKIKKTRAITVRFQGWGLILVDYILPGLPLRDELASLAFDLQHFNTITIINPDGSFAMEWPDVRPQDRAP